MRKRRTVPLLTFAIVMALLTLNVAAAAADDYEFVENDQLEGTSTERGGAKAKAFGHMSWYKGEGGFFGRGTIIRGSFNSNTKIRAIKPVACIWVQVIYNYPNGSLTVGPNGPAGSVSPGSYDATNGFFRSCRRPGHRRPSPIGLGGISYVKRFLSSVELFIGTSRSKREKPRFIGREANVYGNK